MKLAVIPARGGSKRIPRKNIKLFCGKPIIVWSIEAAKQSGCFDRIIVSTDDMEIAGIAVAEGAEVPFIRPSEISDDYTGTIPVIAHAINQINLTNCKVDFACCIYPTAPLLQPKDIKLGLNLLKKNNTDYAISVTNYRYPIQRAIRVKSNMRIEMLYPENINARSQDLEQTLHDAGQFYWGRASAWLAGKPLFSNNTAPVVLPHYLVEDIDTLEDWLHAELLFKALHLKF